MVLLNAVKDVPLGKAAESLAAALGGSKDVSMEPDNYWVELRGKVTLGTFTGGTSPAWASDAGDKLVKELQLQLGGSLTPLKASVVNLKRLALIEHGEEVPADGHFFLPFRGAFPAFLFKNGVKLSHSFETLANLTTGSPTSQTGTKVDYFARIFPRQGKPSQVVGFPIIKTFEIDRQSVSGRREILDLNDGSILRHVLMVPSSGTLMNGDVEVSLGTNGEDVLRKVSWKDLAEQNKKDYFLDAVEGAGGWRAFSFPGLPTDKGQIGPLKLWADLASEASGKVTVVTMSYMAQADLERLLARLNTNA